MFYDILLYNYIFNKVGNQLTINNNLGKIKKVYV